MTLEVKKRILESIEGDAYTKVHAEVIFQNDGRVNKMERIERIVMQMRLDIELFEAICDWQENEQMRINAQGDNHD